MKKALVFLSVLCMLTSPINTSANSVQVYAESAAATETEAEEINGETESFSYRIVGNEAEIVLCKDGIVSVTIPSEINGVPVTKISSNAFNSKSDLTSVILPDTIKSIESFAFTYCTSLTDVNIPESVEYIGEGAFKDCSSLTSFTMPDSVASTGGGIFANCTSLKSVKLSKNLTELPVVYIGGHSPFEFIEENNYGYFMGCSSLEEVEIPSGVTELPYMTFANCTSLENIYTGDNVKSIKYGAFLGCTSLKNVTFGNDLKYIVSYAFQDCTSLETIVIPDSVNEIMDGVFQGCTALKSIDLSENLAKIGYHCFMNCSSLESFYMPDSVTETKGGMFYGCSSLKEIHLSENMTSMELTALGYNGYGFFQDCSKLESVVIPDSVVSIGNTAFKNCTSLTEVKIGSGVSQLSSDMFLNCTSLKNVVIPSNVKTIGINAFKDCTGLESVIIENGVLKIDNFAFNSCTSLKNVSLSDTLEEICWKSFENTNIEEINIPASVKIISDYTFSSCNNLKNITVDADNETYMSVDGALYLKNGKEFISYPAGKEDSEYSVADGTEKINIGALEGSNNLEKVILPESLTYINGYAFKNCKNLSEINIPDSVTIIQSYAFAGCDKLEKLTIPASVEKIYTRIYGFDENNIKYENIAIYGENDSKAQEYAEENEIPFNPPATTATTTTETVITTTTTSAAKPVAVKSYVKNIETAKGWYMSHDNREFSRNQIKKVEMEYLYSDGSTRIEDITYKVDFGTATPENTYKINQTDFTYQIPLYWNEEELKDELGNPVTATVFIGVKGDANLDNLVDATDASYILTYYAKVQTNANNSKIMLSQDNDELDCLAAFLSCVNADKLNSDNLCSDKTEYDVNAIDSSLILTFYSYKQTTTDNISNYDIWMKVIPISHCV